MDNILKVRLLGGFSMNYNGSEVVLDRNIASKTTQMMQIMALNAQSGISKSILFDMLYGDSDVDNPNATLNNCLFRLRKRLKECGIPGSSYVVLDHGLCQWDHTTPIETDCVKYESLIQKGNREEDEAKRMAHYYDAVMIYTGELLPDMIGEEWVSQKNHDYHDLYQKHTTELCAYLYKERKFMLLRRVAHRAAEVYPFETWQTWEIDALIGQELYEEALAVFNRLEEQLFREMNLLPSPELLERVSYIGKHISGSSDTIEVIQKRIEEDGEKIGPYFCLFPSFVDTYRVTERLRERFPIDVMLLLCTLKNKAGCLISENSNDEVVSEIFRQAIGGSLRKGDFFTKYNSAQFLIVVMGIRDEQMHIVTERISRKFYERIGSGSYQVEYYRANMKEVCSKLKQES